MPLKTLLADPAAAWPPPFSVRVSPKAKYARLRVLPGKGLEVVLPRGVDASAATTIVEKHKYWVCRTLKRVCGSGTCETTEPLPDEVILHGGTVRLPVSYGTAPRNGPPGTVTVRAARDSETVAAKELQDWVRGHASDVLGRELAALAQKHGLTYASCRFRRQKSRWGSCSAKGAININTCLVFLPPDLARHILLHELAHTRHMDHGQGFWKTLFAMEPDALDLDRRLRSAWRHVPAWMWL